MKVKYKAYAAANEHTTAYAEACGSTEKNVLRKIRRAVPDWKDQCIWVVYIHANGSEERI